MLTYQATHPRSSGLGPGRGPHAGGGAGELPAGRWQCDDSGSAASLYGRGGGADPVVNAEGCRTPAFVSVSARNNGPSGPLSMAPGVFGLLLIG